MTTLSRLRAQISISLDGFVAGPHQSIDNPLGVGGTALHEWVVPLRTFQEQHGREGGEDNASTPFLESLLADIGATIMGRNMFGGHPGDWSHEEPWTGWWGPRPPFGHPVFVLTHFPREPLELEGTTFTFVTEGIERALEQARAAAGGADVALAGGAQAIRQYLAAGLVDELALNIVPVLLGSGERLFIGSGDDLRGLRVVESIATLAVTHLRFARD
ncbi:MAG: bifunctional deaminase-reductase domain protein [Thermoleophilia bacterium]|nr:bifunctional deaminase-reductase domain protein [Thermoleophilia bacterium]MCZ4495715.1 bifunctional deaminase-reductase domain protein [Thermoleophilia bacterium]